MPHLSEEDLCEELRALAGRLQRLPRKTDMEMYGRYSVQTYLARFDQWDAALTAAGLADRREPHLSRDTLHAHLQNLKNECGRPPTHAECCTHGEFSPWVYIDRFDSWHAALRAVDCDLTPRTDPEAATVTHYELRTALTTLADELGRTPTQDDLDTYGDYASALYTAAFGSWDDAIALAGLPDHSVRGAPTYSTRELLAQLRDLAARLEKPPSAREMNREGAHAAATYQQRFGSWTTALHTAGLSPSTGTDSLPSAADLKAEIERLATECEQPPTPAAVRSHGTYAPSLYLLRFDSWTHAIEAAGFDPARAWNR